jgi:Uma2 family endonuclease
MSSPTACPIVREPMSLDEFFALDVVLAELVDGQPVFMSSPAARHQHLVVQILLALEAHRSADLIILPAPMDWVLWEVPTATVRQPDLLVVPADTVLHQRVTVPPVLVVEVISPDSLERDLVAKRRDYAQARCQHYWLAHPDRRELVTLDLDGDHYVEAGRRLRGGRLTLDAPFPITLDATRLFAGLPPDDIVA